MSDEQNNVFCTECQIQVVTKSLNTTNLFHHLQHHHKVQYGCVKLRALTQTMKPSQPPAPKQTTLQASFTRAVPYERKSGVILPRQWPTISLHKPLTCLYRKHFVWQRKNCLPQWKTTFFRASRSVVVFALYLFCLQFINCTAVCILFLFILFYSFLFHLCRLFSFSAIFHVHVGVVQLCRGNKL